MAGGLKYAVFSTDAGWVGVLASEEGLRRLTLPQSSADEARLLLGSDAGDAASTPRFFLGLIGRLKGYFAGKETTFPDKLDLSPVGAFQRRVWEATRLIPYGETRSYQWVARIMGKPLAVRAVGQALGRNPLPIIIPCHRVIASSGKLGGFGGGLEMKKHLLALEVKANT